MRKVIVCLITAIALLLVAAGAYAADQTDTLGSTVTGEEICTLNITSGSLSVSAPTTKGPSTTEFTGSPVTLDIVDNNFQPVADDVILKVKISSSLPSQYGTDKSYVIAFGDPSGGMYDDQDWFGSGVPLYESPLKVTDSDQDVMGIESTDTGRVLSSWLSVPIYLLVNADKRLYGDTSDSVTIQITFVDK